MRCLKCTLEKEICTDCKQMLEELKDSKYGMIAQIKRYATKHKQLTDDEILRGLETVNGALKLKRNTNMPTIHSNLAMMDVWNKIFNNED